MKIVSADLLDQAFTPSQIPSHPFPQVAMVGRSNVGKSSLLAVMMNRKKLVRVSSRRSVRDPNRAVPLALHLIDIRHPPTRDDLADHAILRDREIPTAVAATKADKLSRSQRLRSLKVIARDLGEDPGSVVAVSAKDANISVGSLWEIVQNKIGHKEG